MSSVRKVLITVQGVMIRELSSVQGVIIRGVSSVQGVELSSVQEVMIEKFTVRVLSSESFIKCLHCIDIP